MSEALARIDSMDRFRAKGIVEHESAQEITKRFQAIEETSEQLGLSVYYLRQGIKSGWIPHIRCGNKAMINVPKLLEILDNMSITANADK